MQLNARITAVDGYLPEHLVTNQEMERTHGISAEWIQARTGFEARHHAAGDETIAYMAAEAARKALAGAGSAPDDIDLIVLATCSATRPIPSIAPEVAARLGVPTVAAFDIVSACAGFTYALSVAANAVHVGQVKNVLVIGSERITNWTTPSDPDVWAIFGDGAGAAVVSAAAVPGLSILAASSDGSRRDVLAIPDGGAHITMQGLLVYRWATSEAPLVAQEACRRAGLTMQDIDWFVPHQANLRIVDSLAVRLGFDPDRVLRDGRIHGNTSAASIPLALASLLSSGRAHPGERALLLGFGAGLSCSALVVALP